MRRLSIPWRDRAIVIADVDEPQSWFGRNEQAHIAMLKLEKRRQEWMLSRIAAKQLARENGICDDLQTCVIENRRIGSWHVSLSHSGPYAAAAIGRDPVGIDVQVVRELKESAAHLFLSDAEEEVMRSIALPHRLLHFWCAKEAEWKRRGGETATLRQVPLKLNIVRPDGIDFDAAETIAIDDVVVALTVIPSS